MHSAYFTTAYFPPTVYLSKLVKADQIYLEANENFQKQSYRNRCQILSSNGIIDLVIPVIKASQHRTHIKDVKIDYCTPWQRMHIGAIVSAYKNAPFFEYYADDFIKIIDKGFTFLFDINTEIIQTLFKTFCLEKNILYTEKFNKENYGNSDFRYCIHPKKTDNNESETTELKPYTQVFEDRFSFIPNLGLPDLLFNLGPDLNHYLTEE